MPKTILLTGAMGFVGKSLLRYARAQGSLDQWIAVDLVQDDTLASCDVPEQYSFHALDLANYHAVETLLQAHQPKVVLHFAGCISKGSDPENRMRLFRSNVETTWNLLSALPCPAYFMLASTGMIYGSQPGPFEERMEVQPSDDYSLCKHLAETAVLDFAKQGRVRAAILRPAVLYGLGQKGDMFIPSLCRALRSDVKFSMTAGEQTRDFVHVRDLCAAVFALLKNETTGTYNIGTSVSISMRAVAEQSASSIGHNDLLGIGEVPYRKQEIWDYRLSSTKLQQATGWLPRIPLTQGIQEILQEKQA